MSERDLNVQYAGIRTTIEVTGIRNLSQVQDAVKAKYGPVMSDVGAAQLRFFDQQSQPIEDLDDIPEEYFQKPKNGGLFLLIQTTPPTSHQPIQRQPSFQPCKTPFYKSIPTIAEMDGWLMFGDVIPSNNLDCLYIRNCYRSIAADIKTPAQPFQFKAPKFPDQSTLIQPYITKAIVTGTPGIGKSLFLFYLLWQLVKDGKRVLYILLPDAIYYDGNGGVHEFMNLPHHTDRSFWNPDLWCLFDAKAANEADLKVLPYARCSFILSTSPRRQLINDFIKTPRPQIFYMPPWTESELEVIASCFSAATDWRNRFKILGGIPRRVLEEFDVDPRQLLLDACTQCNLDDIVKVVGVDSEITEKTKVVHILVHMTSQPPFKKPSVVFASEVALDTIVAKKGAEAKHKMESLLQSCDGDSHTAALCGYIFEPYTLKLLEKDGTFTCRELEHGNKKTEPAPFLLTIDASVPIIAEKPKMGQERRLHLPRVKNNPAIDAWIPGVGAFQITVGKRHDLHSGCQQDLAQLGVGCNKLYWMLPPLYYYTFTKQTTQKIQQFAMLIPYPE